MGAAFTLLVGSVKLEDVLFIVSSVWDAVVAFVLLIFISIVLDKGGFFEWSALKLMSFSKGSGFLLYVYIMLLTALTAALFANDGAMLMLTPLVYAKLRNLGVRSKDMVPYFIAIGFMSESASLPFIISNLTNIITAKHYSLSFWEYALYMFVPYTVSVTFTTFIFWVFYKSNYVKRFELEFLQDKPTRLAIKDPTVFFFGWIAIAFIGVSFLIIEILHIQIFVSFVLGVACLIVALSTLNHRVVSLREVLNLTPWHVVIFAIGMYVVVYQLKYAGLVDAIAKVIDLALSKGALVGFVGVGLLSSLLSAVFNNLPAVLMVNLGIDELGFSQTLKKFLGLSNVIGTNIGQKMTPIGSLATLLWLHLLGHRDIHISYWEYFKKNASFAMLTTLVVLISLYLIYIVIGR